MERATMTLMDCYHAMRQAGIPSSPKSISAGIADGRYPFGSVVHVGETRRKTFQIFRVDFSRWLREKTETEEQKC